MQYILSEEEFKALQRDAERGRKGISEKELQELCTMACNTIPVDTYGDNGEKEPWGCILTTKGEWYCDDCPVEKYCPYPLKNWSK